MNKNLTRYYSRHTRQHTQMELADGLKVCMIAAIKEWAIINGKLVKEWAIINGT